MKPGLSAWIASIAIATAPFAAGAQTAALAPAPSSPAGTVASTQKSSHAVPMHAELIRRADGRWVISRLARTEELERHAAPLSEDPTLGSTMESYRKALSRSDLDGLSNVWIMNPSERKQMRRVASSGSRVSVQIEDATFSVDGDRAFVTFLQTQKRSPASGSNRMSKRGLAAYDSSQAWDVVSDE